MFLYYKMLKLLLDDMPTSISSIRQHVVINKNVFVHQNDIAL